MRELGFYLRRITRPFGTLWNSLRFSAYFFFFICFLGALGAWVPACQLWYGSESVDALYVYRNLATYIISIAVTAFVDCLLRNQDDDRTLLLIFFILLVIAVLPAILVLVIDDLAHLVWLSSVGAMAAALVWLNVHDLDQDLTEVNRSAPLGGEVSQ